MGRSPSSDRSESKLNKGAWTEEEDKLLINYMKFHGIGDGSWRSLPKAAGLLRCGKSCRLRWTNYLRPDIKRGNFTQAEEQAITQLQSTLGNKWSQIADHFPGRTDNEIKNYWNTHIRRKLFSQGPNHKTHCPLNIISNDNNNNNTKSYLEILGASSDDDLSQVENSNRETTTEIDQENNNRKTAIKIDQEEHRHHSEALSLELSLGLPCQLQLENFSH